MTFLTSENGLAADAGAAATAVIANAAAVAVKNLLRLFSITNDTSTSKMMY